MIIMIMMMIMIIITIISQSTLIDLRRFDIISQYTPLRGVVYPTSPPERLLLFAIIVIVIYYYYYCYCSLLITGSNRRKSTRVNKSIRISFHDISHITLTTPEE